MKYTHYLSDGQLQTLKRARDIYGETNQILVSCEELTELAAICAKYPRYSDHDKAHKDLYSKALDEVADVLVVLDHVINIFGITPEDLQTRINGKVSRLERWINTSSDMEQTTRDREVTQVSYTQMSLFDTELTSRSTPVCTGCRYYKDFSALKIGGMCHLCAGTGANFTPKETSADEVK